jgi:signal transduction histidine kinase
MHIRIPPTVNTLFNKKRFIVCVIIVSIIVKFIRLFISRQKYRKRKHPSITQKGENKFELKISPFWVIEKQGKRDTFAYFNTNYKLMIRNILFAVLLLLPALRVTGQAQSVDSLVNVLNTKTHTSTEQLELYRKITLSYLSLYDLDKASGYAKDGLRLAEKERNRVMASKFNADLGRIYVTKASYDTAFVYYEKALERALEAKDEELEAEAYARKGILFAMQTQNITALEYFMKALALSEKIGDKQGCIVIMSNMASLYRGMENMERVIYYLEKAGSLAEEINYEGGKKQVYYELGAVYHHLASERREQEKIDLALEYSHKAYDISRKLGDKSYQMATAQALAIIYSDYTKDDAQAEQYANENLQLALESGHPYGLLAAWNALARVYRVQKRYKESEEASLQALAIDSTNVYMAIGLTSNIVLANVAMGNLDKSSLYLRKYDELIKKHIDQSGREILAEMEVKYETEKKEIRIASLEKERRLYVWLGIAAILLVMALGIAFWLKIRNARKEKQLVAANAVQDGEMNERARLAGDLHDRLSGNLAAVKMELGSAESLQNIGDKLDGCIDEIRRITHNLMPRSLKSGMRAALQDFTAQFPNVHFHFFGEEKRIKERLEFIIYCCANELVTNSLRHSGAKNINVQLIQDEKHVSLIVQDDGCGFDEKSVVKGIGLQNVRDRVASCNGKIDIVSLVGKGTETNVELKVES